MKPLSPTILVITLFITFVAICATANGCVHLPLPAVVLVGLGAHAAYFLWDHRVKMSGILGPRARISSFPPPNEVNDLNKAA